MVINFEASSMFAPGIDTMLEDFGSTNLTLGSFSVSVYICGFICGPLLFAPLSEFLGRAIVLHFTNVCFVFWNLGCGFSNSLLTLIITRFFAGVCASAAQVLGGGFIHDLIRPENQGFASAFWMIGPLWAPIMGPIA